MASREHSDLGIRENERLQRVTWVLQRVAWGLMAALIVGGLAGVFGRGPLASARGGDPVSPPWVEYERFVRAGTPTRLTVHLAAGPGGEARALLGAEYLRAVAIESVVPAPERWALHEDGAEMVFRASAGASAVIHLRPQRAGALTGRITQDGRGVTFGQWVYP